MHHLKLRRQQELQHELQNHVSLNDVNTVVNENTPELHEDHPVVQQNNFRNRQCNYFLLPIGQRCNMDGYIFDHKPFFDVVQFNLECFYCGGRGWHKENCGSRTTPHFGQMCCLQKK